MVLDHQEPLIFRLFFPLIFQFYSKPLLGTVFRGSQRRPIMKSWICVSLPIFMVFKKAPFGRPLRPKRVQSRTEPNSGERPFRDPAFHETTIILMPLGPSDFKNIIFSMMIGYFSIFSDFHCAMFYMSFLLHLLKNLGKRPAVEPFYFLEKPTRLKKQRFFLFCFFTFVFCILLYNFVD